MSGNKANRKPLVEALPPTTAPDRQQKISQRKQSVDGGKRKVAIELASSSETVLASSPSALKKKSIQAVPPVPLSTTETENSSKQQENDEESMKDDENGVGESNDLEEIFAMCQARNQQSFFLRLTMGLVSLLDLQVFLTNIGRCLLNLGDGITLLHLAAQYNREDWAVYLLEVCRHPVEVKTSRGETPLDQAAWRGHVTIAILLLKYGADIDCQTKSKYTPLHRCAYYNHQRLAGLLVMAGATQQLPDEHQQTAYHVAVAQQHYEIASLLKPVYDAQGKDITGLQYLLNNPKHSQYRSESREIFFQLFVMEQNLQQQKELTMQQLQAVATQPPLQYRPYPLHPLAVQQAGPALSFPSSFTSSSSSSSRHVAIGSNRPLDIKAHDKNHEEDDIRNEEVEKEETADDERRSQHKGKRCLTMRHSTKSKKKR